jgi:hypothetical protein
MSSPITEYDSKFKDTIGGCFHAMLRAAGITMTPAAGMERLRDVAGEMAEAIEWQAERKSVEVARKLQTAVRNAFQSMEEDLVAVRKENDGLRERLEKVESFMSKRVGL